MCCDSPEMKRLMMKDGARPGPISLAIASFSKRGVLRGEGPRGGEKTIRHLSLCFADESLRKVD